MKNTPCRGAGQSPRQRTYGHLLGQCQPHDHYPHVIVLLRWLREWLVPLLRPLMPAPSPKTSFPMATLVIALLVQAILGVRSLGELLWHWAYADEVRQALGWERCPESLTPFAALWRWCQPQQLDQVLAGVVRQMLKWGLLDGQALILDTTFFHVWGISYVRAQKGRSGQLQRQIRGYKVWIVFDARNGLPVALHLAPGDRADVRHALTVWRKAVKNLGKRRIRSLVMDRGFHSQDLWQRLSRVAPQVTIVCRIRRGTKRFDRRAAALQRQARPVCAGYACAAGPVRGGQIVWIHRPEYLHPLVLWTNNRELTASAVYQLYRQRGRIEYWIKQMKGDWRWGRFPGSGWGQVVGHLYLTVLAYLVQRAFQQAYSRKTHRWQIRRFRQEVYQAIDPLPLAVLLHAPIPLDRIRRNVRRLVERLPQASKVNPETLCGIAATITQEVPHAA